jgi:hypothetical protein
LMIQISQISCVIYSLFHQEKNVAAKWMLLTCPRTSLLHQCNRLVRTNEISNMNLCSSPRYSLLQETKPEAKPTQMGNTGMKQNRYYTLCTDLRVQAQDFRGS